MIHAIRLTLFVVLRFIGHRLTMAVMMLAAWFSLIVHGFTIWGYFLVTWAVLLVAIVAGKLARIVRPKPKAPKLPAPATVTRLAPAVDAPDEATFTGRLRPEYQRLLDPPGQPLDRAATPESVPAPPLQSP